MPISPIFLVGMPAVGKSTLGKQAAQKYQLEFIDLDEYIENNQGRSVRKIFEESGELYFRQVEAECLAIVAKMQDVLVATGGGTPCFHNSMKLMLQKGQVIFLDFPLEALVERITNNSPLRPIFVGKKKFEVAKQIEELYKKRLPHYLLAHYVVKDEKQFWESMVSVLHQN
ncbi:MAG: shikimate kinase [Raineya sp.]